MIIFSLSIDLLGLLQGYMNIAFIFYIHVFYISIFISFNQRFLHSVFMAYTYSYFSAFQSVVLFKIL